MALIDDAQSQPDSTYTPGVRAWHTAFQSEHPEAWVEFLDVVKAFHAGKLSRQFPTLAAFADWVYPWLVQHGVSRALPTVKYWIRDYVD